MQIPRPFLFSNIRFSLFCIALAVSFFAPSLHAQSTCPDGSSPDTLGCATQLPRPPEQVESPSTLSVEERPESDLPSADRSNEASAKGSLPGEASLTEGAALNREKKPQRGPITPDKPNEFQKFVAATIGQMLPIYGSRFFTTQPASFGPIDHGPAPGEIILGPDDELRIRIWGQVNFSANLRVSREGEIYLPKIGAIHVAGIPFSSIPAHLRSAIERVYRNFELSVDLGEIHTIQIYVTGMARQPGEFTVSALYTLVDAVFAVGGPSGSGSMRHVRLVRAEKVIADFDLYALLAKGDKSGDAQLQSGDVLFFAPTGPQVALVGSVREPAIYELLGGESIAQLVTMAGGRTAVASGAQIHVDRIENEARRRTFAVSSDQAGMATTLADGDIVRIDPIVSIYRDAVTLRGAVANPGRFQWHEGMRLSDLMPERDALLRRDYWWYRTRLGLPAPQFAEPDSANSPNAKPDSLESPAAQTNWNQAVIERLDPSTMTTRLIPFPLGKLVLERDMTQDLTLQPGDVITIFAQQDIQIPIQEQSIYVELAGEFVHPGVYSVSPGETLRSVVARAGGFTDRAYLFGSNFTRKSTQAVEQQRMSELAEQLEEQMQHDSLGLLHAYGSSEQQSASGAGREAESLDHELIARIRQARATGRVVLNLNPGSRGLDAVPDMHLEDGDKLLVPFIPETVQVIGAVFNPHAFLYADHARVGQYLHLAGGPNRTADRKHIYVLRADGSVVARGRDNSAIAADLKNLRLYPGDTIVVPEKDVRLSQLKPLLDLNQLMAQLSVASTGLSVLK